MTSIRVEHQNNSFANCLQAYLKFHPILAVTTAMLTRTVIVNCRLGTHLIGLVVGGRIRCHLDGNVSMEQALFLELNDVK